MITAKQLARIINEELKKDNWGEIDPYWFEMVVNNEKEAGEWELECAESVKDLLETVAKRLNEEIVATANGLIVETKIDPKQRYCECGQPIFNRLKICRQCDHEEGYDREDDEQQNQA